jgi:hypothetical protein
VVIARRGCERVVWWRRGVAGSRTASILVRVGKGPVLITWLNILTHCLLFQADSMRWGTVVVTAVLAIVVNLLIVAFGYGRFSSKVDLLQVEVGKMSEGLEKEIKNIERDLVTHRENTDRHRDPQRDGQLFQELKDQLARMDIRFDRLEAKIDNIGERR